MCFIQSYTILALGSFSHYDLSIWKQVDSIWSGILCFVFVAIAFASGIIFLALAVTKAFILKVMGSRHQLEP